jgi:hypothetical protein
LDDATKAPSRAAELVYSGGGKEPSFESDFTSGIGLPSMAVGEDFLIFDAIEKRGNVWMLDPETDR